MALENLFLLLFCVEDKMKKYFLISYRFFIFSFLIGDFFSSRNFLRKERSSKAFEPAFPMLLTLHQVYSPHVSIIFFLNCSWNWNSCRFDIFDFLSSDNIINCFFYLVKLLRLGFNNLLHKRKRLHCRPFYYIDNNKSCYSLFIRTRSWYFFCSKASNGAPHWMSDYYKRLFGVFFHQNFHYFFNIIYELFFAEICWIRLFILKMPSKIHRNNNTELFNILSEMRKR